MKKYESYLDVALNSTAPKKPYMYRAMTLEGWAASDEPFAFNFNLAAMMDVRGYTFTSLAKECHAYSAARGLGIKMSAGDISHYVHLQCKPKEDKRELLCAVLNVHKSWLTGYNSVAGKEALAEAAVISATKKGINLVSERGFTAAKKPKFDFPTTISRSAYNSMNQLLAEAKILEDNLKKGA